MPQQFPAFSPQYKLSLMVERKQTGWNSPVTSSTKALNFYPNVRDEPLSGSFWAAPDMATSLTMELIYLIIYVFQKLFKLYMLSVT